MSFPLLELPIEMVTAIFGFADDRSLLKLSETSKITNKLAWSIFLKRNQTLERIKFVEMSGDKVFVQFSFGSDNIRSKFIVLDTMNAVQANAFFDNSEGLHTTMTTAETIQFFDQMLSKIEGINANSLEFEPTPTMISLLSKIFKGKSVPELIFKLEDEILAFDSLNNLVSKLETTSIHVQTGAVFPDYYLYLLADVVDSIVISGETSGRERALMAFTAVDILSRRCSHVDLTNSSLTFEPIHVLLLSRMLNHYIGDGQFSFSVNAADNYIPPSDFERRRFAENNHVVEVTMNKNSYYNNLIELRHINMIPRKKDNY